MTSYLICQLSKNKKPFGKQFYVFFIINNEKKITYQLKFFKAVMVDCTSLLKVIGKPW